MPKNTECISLRARKLKGQLKVLATQRGYSLSKLCRIIVEEYLDSHLPASTTRADMLLTKSIEEMSEDQVRQEWRIRGLDQEISFESKNEIEYMRAILMVQKSAERNGKE